MTIFLPNPKPASTAVPGPMVRCNCAACLYAQALKLIDGEQCFFDQMGEIGAMGAPDGTH